MTTTEAGDKACTSPNNRPLFFNHTDAGNAELLANLFAGCLLFDHTRHKWLIWQGHRWEPDMENKVLGFAIEAARKRTAQVRAGAGLERSQEDQELKWARRSEDLARLNSALKIASINPALSDLGREWDSAEMLLGVKNGVVNLRAGVLRKGHPIDRISLNAGTEFDSAAKCPRWENFLSEIFGGNRELIDYMQRAVGYTLTASAKEQVYFLCYGTGANGKSTFLDTLKLVLGEYAHNLPFSAFEQNGRSAIPNDLASLKGKRFVTALETNESSTWNEARLKMLTGSDEVTARHLYGEFFTFRPVGKFWLAVNHKPTVRDDSEGFWRRVRLIPFNAHFDENTRDRNLAEKLKAEIPGILNWAVEGSLKWQRVGLRPPQCIAEASQSYREENDNLAQFIGEQCELGTLSEVPVSELRSAYVILAF